MFESSVSRSLAHSRLIWCLEMTFVPKKVPRRKCCSVRGEIFTSEDPGRLTSVSVGFFVPTLGRKI